MKLDLRHIKKVILAKIGRQNRRVPPFVLARSNRKANVNPKGNRRWRNQKIGLTYEKLKKKLKG